MRSQTWVVGVVCVPGVARRQMESCGGLAPGHCGIADAASGLCIVKTNAFKCLCFASEWSADAYCGARPAACAVNTNTVR